jgi:hypothetical protein
MEKPYLNLKELQNLLGKGRYQTLKVKDYLLKIAKDKKYYIPETKREILIPTELIKKELKIKGEIN